MHNASSPSSGFTLLELLVALTICTFIGIGSHAMLQSVIATQQASKEHSRQLTQLQKALWIMTQDILQSYPQTIAIPADNYTAALLRRGWSNPLGLPRSDMMHVAYNFEGNVLKRYYWSADDPGAIPQVQNLLEDVSSFTIQPTPGLAIEINLTSQTYGTVRRVVEIPEL